MARPRIECVVGERITSKDIPKRMFLLEGFEFHLPAMKDKSERAYNVLCNAYAIELERFLQYFDPVILNNAYFMIVIDRNNNTVQFGVFRPRHTWTRATRFVEMFINDIGMELFDKVQKNVKEKWE